MPRLSACPFESRSSAKAGVGVRGGVTGEEEAVMVATPTTADAADCECECDGERSEAKGVRWLASAWVGDSSESWQVP